MSHTLSLTIWRDSVCAGDDGDAPHEIQLVLPADASLQQFAERFTGGAYLASIIGGQATWILEGRQPLAVLAQQWTQPRFLVPPNALLAPWVAPEEPHFQFRYWCQTDPERVFDCLQRGQPLPDRYGR